MFVPVGFMGGITGRALPAVRDHDRASRCCSRRSTRSRCRPALAALLLKAPTGKKTLLTPFYNWFNKVFGAAPNGYVSFTRILVRKMVRSLMFIGVLVVADRAARRAHPGGLRPRGGPGLHPGQRAAARRRLARAHRRGDEEGRGHHRGEPRGVEGYNTVTGFSLLTGAYSSNMGFFFVQLKAWHERHSAEEHANGVVAALNRAFARQIPEATVVAFGPPAIPGLGTGAGFTMQLQDRAATRPSTWPSRPQRFMQAARKRPEIGRVSTLYRASVPQVYADIDRGKVLKLGRAARRTSTPRSARCSAAPT